MKTSTFVIAALFASVQADAPPYFNEPPFAVATHPAAAGLIQIQTACVNSGLSGVTCGPSDQELFATGMNGDEDLGEDITMKGDKFHFVQNVQLSAEPAAEAKAAAPAEAKAAAPAEAKAEAPAEAKAAAPAEAKAAAPAEAKAAAPAEAKVAAEPAAEAKAPVPEGTAQPTAGAAEKKGKVIYDTKGYGPVEKISFFDPKIAKAHTSFYAQSLVQAEPEAAKAPAKADAKAAAPAKADAKAAAPAKLEAKTVDGVQGVKYDTTGYGPVEKISFFDPKIAMAHTSFYAQAEPAAAAKAEPAANATAPVTAPVYPPPEKVHTLDPKIAKAHTTFYHQQKSALIQIDMEDIPKTETPETFTGVKDFPYPGPEQVHTLDPKIAKGHNTFYNKQ